jgi:small subunit ribosomal protein S16
MAVVIRLSRSGRRNAPMYRLTVADSRRWRDGKFLDRVGWYNPRKNEAKDRYHIDLTKVDEWIKKGAKPSETVAELLKTYRKQAALA